MAKCLRCGGGNEWIEGEAKADTVPRSRYIAQESELIALSHKHDKVVKNAKAEIERLQAELAANGVKSELKRRVAELESQLQDETKIVSRIWELLGSPDYDELKGRSIYDVIQGWIDRAISYESKLNRCLEVLRHAERFANQDYARDLLRDELREVLR